MKLKRFLYCLLAVSLSLTALTSNAIEVSAAAQDFTTYNEFDLGSDLTVVSDNITFDLERLDTARVYKDFGAGYFSEDFQVNFEWEVTTSVSGSEYGVLLISNTVGAMSDLIGKTFAGVGVWMINTGIPDEVQVHLYEVDSGLTGYASTSHMHMTKGKNYYFTLLRDDDAGTNGLLTLNRYNDSERQNLSGTIHIDLAEKQNFRYFHAITAYDGAGVYTTTGVIANLDLDSDVGLVPDVVTYEEFDQANPQGALLMGWASGDWGDNIAGGFDMGTASGNYTTEYMEAHSFINAFTALVPAANMTIGTTYYFRAKAQNAYGWGYGTEKSFEFTSQLYTMFLSDATVVELVSGNFSVAFIVRLDQQFTDNVTAWLSASADFSNLISLYNLYATGGQYLFDTCNGTVNCQAPLLPDTTYYYQGVAEYNDTLYGSETKSFTTTAITPPSKPSVEIIELHDVSDQYDELNDVFEVRGRAITSNTTDNIINQGVQLSQNVSPTGALLPEIYEWQTSTLAPDGTFYVLLFFDNATWYDGQTLYFRTFIQTPYYGKILSSVIDFTPEDREREEVPDGDEPDADIIESFDDIIAQVRASMHLYGVMGTWAFMGLILVILALVFGIGMIAVPTGIGKAAVGVAWLLSSVAVLGAFIFTGELGIWPLIIMVGGVVALIIVVLSLKLSGGGQNG